eukprot:4101121-Pyramimonas_sp.AAC.2
MCAVTHAVAATRGFGGAPKEATKRVRGVPQWARSHMRPWRLGSSVELPMGPRDVCREQRRAVGRREQRAKRRSEVAGRCLFKTMTQHHRMLEKSFPAREPRTHISLLENCSGNQQ